MNNSDMYHDALTPPWISKAHSAWLNGDYGICKDTLIENSVVRLNLFDGDNPMFLIDTNSLEKPILKKSSDVKTSQPTPFEQSFGTHRERGYALSHNIALSYYLNKGTTFGIQFKDSENESKGRENHYDEANDSNASLKNQLIQLERVSATAAYNLAFTHFMTGNYQQCSKACEEIFNQTISQKIQDSKASINSAYLYIHAQLMLGDVNNQKLQDVIAFLEKSIGSFIVSTGEALNSSTKNDIEMQKLIKEHNNYLEYDVWIRIFKTQISLIQTKMKLSKREVSAMMISLSKWDSFRKEHIQVIDPNMEVEPQSATEGQESEKKTKYPTRTHAAVQLIKARLLDLRNSQDKADTELKEAYVRELCPSLYFNNLGVIEFHRKNYTLAATHFNYAYEETKKLKNSLLEVKKFHYPYQHVKYGILYNMAVQALMLGQSEAKACFKYLSTKPGYSTNPIIWIRLAESEIQRYLAKTAPKSPEFPVASIYPEGGKIEINASRPLDIASRSLLEEIVENVQVALLLIERVSNSSNQIVANEKLYLLKEYTQKVYCYTLLSWLSLELEDYNKCREYALLSRELQGYRNEYTGNSQTIEEQLNHYFFLAQLYLGESELRFGNLDEALNILNDSILTGEKDINPKAILYCNLASVYIVKGDFDQAQNLLNQANSLSPSLTSSKILQVYFALRNRNAEMAATLLREYRISDLWISTRK